jgi:hypothetical protein
VRAGVAEGRTADQLRGDQADRRDLEVATRVPVRLHGHHHGLGRRAAGLFSALLALSYYAGQSRSSADYYLEKKISWWWKLAETRRPDPAEAPVPAGAVPAQATPATAPDSAAPGKLPHAF